jgi:hypothetical protein
VLAVSEIITAEPISHGQTELAVTMVTLLGEAWPMEAVPPPRQGSARALDLNESAPVPPPGGGGTMQLVGPARMASAHLAGPQQVSQGMLPGPRWETTGSGETSADDVLHLLETLVLPAMEDESQVVRRLLFVEGRLMFLTCCCSF